MGFFTVSILTKIIEREDIELILVSCGEVEVNFKKKIDKKNIHLEVINASLPFFEQLWLPFLIKKYSPDVCWFPSNTFPLYKVKNTKYIVTIHDLIFLDKGVTYNNFNQLLGKLYRSTNIVLGAYKIDVITSVSKTALSEIFKYFKIRENKIDNDLVLYNSVSDILEFNSKILNTLGLSKRKYIYTISGCAPHKNFKLMIDSFKILNKKYNDYILVVSGMPENLQSTHASKNIIYTKYVSNSEKACLIKNANFFVFSSLREGFGIPLIEGMLLNKNILVSKIPIFEEICGNYANYHSVSEVNFLINYVESSAKVTNNLQEVAEYIGEKFNLDKTVIKLISIIKSQSFSKK